MNTAKKTFIAIAVTGIFTGGSLAVLAGTSPNRAFRGLAVEGVVAVKQLPTEVRAGSIKIKDDNELTMAAQTRITSSGAARIATIALPGKVVKTEMEDENGYLIWDVEAIGSNGKKIKLKIDAGNGYLQRGRARSYIPPAGKRGCCGWEKFERLLQRFPLPAPRMMVNLF